MAHPDPSKRHRSKRNPNRASTTGFRNTRRMGGGLPKKIKKK